MKKINILSSCLAMAMLASVSTQAQFHKTAEKHRQNANPEVAKAIKMFSQANANAVIKAKPNLENSRLLAVSNYYYDAVDTINIPNDSFNLYWHDTIGASFNYLNYIGYNPFNSVDLTPAEELLYNQIKVDSYKSYSWNGTAYEASYKQEQELNEKDFPIVANNYSFIDPLWEINGYSGYSYTNEGLLAVENNAYFDTWSMSWNFSRTEHTYDENGNLTISLRPFNNVDSFFYNAENKLTKSTHYYYSSGWVANGQRSYTYTGGNKTSEVYSYWNGTTWVNSSRSDYSYNSNNDLQTYKYSYWNSVSNSWDSNSRSDYSYNSSNIAYEIENFSYNSGTTSWDNSSKYTGEYTGSNLTLLTISYWNGTEWINDMKVDYEYNTYDQCTLVEVYGHWNSADTVWEKADYDELYNLYYELFDDGVINIKTVNKIDFNIFPNPTNEVLNINTGNEQISSIAIYDNAGRIITQQNYNSQVQGNLQINVSNLATGAYVIKLQGKNATGTKTFVKQ